MKKTVLLVLAVAIVGCGRDEAVPWGSTDRLRPAPKQVTAVAENATEVTIRWTDVPGAASYNVYLATDSNVTKQNVAFIADGRAIPNAVSPQAVDTLSAGTTYYFVVTATHGNGESAESAWVSATPFVTPRLPATTPAWTGEGGQLQGLFGETVANAGDVNGDGFDDVLIAAPNYTQTNLNEGVAFLYLGSAAGLGTSADWSVTGGQDDAGLGQWLAPAGDVNGDGFADVLIGAPLLDIDLTGDLVAEADVGRLYLYQGSATGLSATPDWSFDGTEIGSILGLRATAADINADGFTDVLVAEPLKDIDLDMMAPPESDVGRAYLFLGAATGLATTAAWTADGDEAGENFGIASVAVGTVSDDQFLDVLIGAHRAGSSDDGGAHLFLGAASGLDALPVWTLDYSESGAFFGQEAAPAGDVDNDGFGDVFIAARGDGAATQGNVWLYEGSAAGTLTQSVAWFGDGAQSLGGFGADIASGDVNGDGLVDLVVGADDNENEVEFAGEGRLELFIGETGTLSDTPVWRVNGGQADAHDGRSVHLLDVNGDGALDVLSGAGRFDVEVQDEGRVVLYYGDDGLAPDVTAGDLLTIAQGQSISPANALFVSVQASSCTWDWGDGTAPTVLSPCTQATLGAAQHAYLQPGSFAVRLRVDDVFGRYGESVTQIVVP